MVYNTSAAKSLTNFFFWTGIMPTRFDPKTNTFVTKPNYLFFHLIALITQNICTLSIGVYGQLKSRWYYHDMLFVDALSVFFRDLMVLFAYPLFILLIYSTKNNQAKFLNKSIEFDIKMTKAFGADPLPLQKPYSAIWMKCIVWTIYYIFYIMPMELYVNGYEGTLTDVIYMCSYTLSLSGIGLACSYIEFCITICFCQTDRLHRIIATNLGKVGAPNALDNTIKAFDMTRDVGEIRQHFGVSFANAILFICQGATVKAVFVLFFFVQQISSERFVFVAIDVLTYFFPLAIRIFKLAGSLQDFGTKVSIYFMWELSLIFIIILSDMAFSILIIYKNCPFI